MPRRRRSASRPILTILLIVVAVPVLAALAVYVFVDPNSFKPRIEAAVHAATGRDLAIRGPIRIGLALSPTLQASDVHLSNPPGFSRPDMASLSQVQAQLSLWPLLRGRLEIVRLVLTEPDVKFETDAQGQGNWHLAPTTARPPASAPSSASASASTPAPEAPRFAVGSVQISGGQVAWPGEVVTIHQLAASLTGPISATADVTAQGHDVALTAETGSLGRLLATDTSGPGWPLQLVARVEGARLAASGTIERPLDGRNYQLSLDAAVPDLAALGTLIGRTLPALRDVSASAKVADTSGTPVLSALLLRAGASDLGTVAAGLSLQHLEISAPGLDQPLHADLDGTFAATPLHVVAALGAPAALFARNSATSFPVDITAAAAGASVSAKGGIANPAALSGLDVAVSARVPDLAALAPLAGRPLPGLHDLAFDARLSDRDGGYANGIVLHGLALTGSLGDLAGDLTLGFKPRLSVQGQLTGKRLDLDGLQAAIPAGPTAPVAAPAPAAPAATAPATPAAPAGPKHLISDRPFDLTPVTLFDSDLHASIGEIRSGGVAYRDLDVHAVASQGRLTLDPFTATLPGGKLDLRYSVDASQAEPPMTLSLSAPGLALKPLLTIFGLPDDATGTAELEGDLTAAGRTPHALAATVSGKLGIAITDAELDNRLLASTVGAVLRGAKLPPDLVLGNGRTRVKCAVMRADATHGVATVASLVLDLGRALVQGTGVVNLADETLGLRLRPLLRTGVGLVVPVRVVGPMAAPNVALDSGGALEGVAGGLAGGLAGLARNPLAALVGAERGGDACGPALASARAARPAAK